MALGTSPGSWAGVEIGLIYVCLGLLQLLGLESHYASSGIWTLILYYSYWFILYHTILEIDLQ